MEKFPKYTTIGTCIGTYIWFLLIDLVNPLNHILFVLLLKLR